MNNNHAVRRMNSQKNLIYNDIKIEVICRCCFDISRSICSLDFLMKDNLETKAKLEEMSKLQGNH